MYSVKKSVRENQHHSLIMLTYVVLKDSVKQAKILLTTTAMFEPRISFTRTSKTAKFGNTENFCAILSWQTKLLNNFTKSPLFVSMTINSKRNT